METFVGGFEGTSTPTAGPANARADAHSGSQHCVFCQSPDWQWFRYLGAAAAGASRTLPQFIVTCEPCETLLLLDDRDGLSARIEAIDPGESDDLLAMRESILSVTREPRS